MVQKPSLFLVVGFLEQPIAVFVRLQRPFSFNELLIFSFLFYWASNQSVLADDEWGPGQFVDIGTFFVTALTDTDFVEEVTNSTS